MKKEAVKSVHGQETIGSAYRANNTEEMWDQFHSIVDGKYAEILSERCSIDLPDPCVWVKHAVIRPGEDIDIPH